MIWRRGRANLPFIALMVNFFLNKKNMNIVIKKYEVLRCK